MNKWKNVKIGEEDVNVKWSDKHMRWEVIYNNKMYFCHGVGKSTSPVQVADIFYREGRDTTVFYV